MPPSLRITAIVAAYNEADIIAQTVGDLVRHGIAVHVLDNHSTDGTVTALEPFLNTGLLEIELFPPEKTQRDAPGAFAWADILARKQQLARELDADWFIHHDADEFRESPWRHLNLREGVELVDRLGYNAIDFAVFNFRPTHNRFDPATDVRDQFTFFERGAPFDQIQVKCWKKAADLDLVSSGGHEATFESRRVFPIRFLLRHYPIRSREHGLRKVFAERVPRFSEEERQRGWHVQYEGITTAEQFVRDASSLEAFDAEAARVQLQIEHRHTEELESRLRESDLEMRALTSTFDHTRAELERTDRELQRERDERKRESESYAAQLTATAHEHQALLDDTKGQLRELERQLVELRLSWSWRLTAPLRAIWRMLR